MKQIRIDAAILRTYLDLYGADIDSWPEHIKAIGYMAQHHSTLAHMIAQERRFERLLREHNSFSLVSPILADRIIAAARPRSPSSIKRAHDALVLNRAAMAAMLMLGFIIGFGAISEVLQNKAPQVQSYDLDDTGAVE